MQIVMKRTADLIPYARNPRKNDDAINGVAASLKEFGFKQPIVVDRDGVIVAGHTRAKAAQKLGLETVPCVVADDLTPEQIKAYRILDNKLAEKAEWEPELLHLELSEITLDLEPFEVDFGEDVEPDEAMRDVAEDEIPEPLPIATTRRGDVWCLGEHRILCGDALATGSGASLFQGVRVDLVFTDPPYAIFGSSTGIAKDIADDKMIRPFFAEVLRACERALKPFAHAYVCCDWRSWSAWWEVAKDSGLAPKNMIVWDKGSGLGAMYANAHELLFFASYRPRQTQMTQNMAGERTVNGLVNVWRVNRAGSEETGEVREHNAQKPIGLIARAIEPSTDAGDLVADFFLGSGSTLIACEQLGRTCYGMEIEPRYVDVAVRRWQKLTGKDAIHEATGETFNQRESGNFSQSTIGAPNGG